MKWLAMLGVLLMNAAALSVEIVAHRGASHDAPENTLSAFKLAWKQNADAIEGDFYLTKDGQIIALHDADTKRTTGHEGKVAEMTLAELRKLEAGKWKSPQFTGEKLPTFKEVIEVVPAGKKKFLIEIKCGPEIVPQLKKEIEASGVSPEQLRIICFKEEVIAACKREMPQIKAYWLFNFKQAKDGTWNATQEQVLARTRGCNADGLDIGFTKATLHLVDEKLVKMLRDNRLEFHVWTVDDPAIAKRAVELGADSITTNRPAFIREQLKLGMK